MVTLKKQFCGKSGLRKSIMAIKRDQADIWCSKAVRLRDGHCLRCGNTETLQAMHLVGRRNKVTRYSLDNLLTGCAACHRWLTENPIEAYHWYEMVLGSGHMEILREKSRGILKTNEKLRKEIAAHYREEFRKKEKNPDHTIVSWN